MKKLLILSLLLLPLTVMAKNQPLKSFEQVMDALKQGQTVSAVFYYKDCQLISDNEIEEESVDAIGGMKIDTWEYFAKGSIRNKEAFVVASTSKLIANPKGKGYVYNYVKIKIYESGKVKITANYLDSVTHEETMTENFFTTINNGTEGAAHFFAQ
jgi:phage terminase large subunit-like protein